ncbi:UDP-glucose dehydrogenase family protein [Legionella fairfieldensis]|uniref:UDP-glucose dehydrogenase family protein n=1 Tax=Legionella fairfieldensis TaxID=45064 RepID=UPI00048AA3F2|nr:UDP-glucose/GDP-mannose dehydrogenase family protein [Legionella fairfieldensis]
MLISVYGAGYVGLVTAVCLARLGHQVICTDVNEQRIVQLQKANCPIYEEQLPELLQEQIANKRLFFTADLTYAVNQASVHFIATGTPGLADGSADLSQVFAVASFIARETNGNGLIVTKSTVPVGTGDIIQARVEETMAQVGNKNKIAVVSNPEFLREGTAVYDFLNADRIIIGGEQQALAALEAIYQPLVEQGVPLLRMSRRSAELTKYSANAMLACRISFMNQISQLAESLGADIDEIRQGMALDHRIGPHFLQAGIGYGGSCFPKDVRALVHTAAEVSVDTHLLEAIEKVNQSQKQWVFNCLKKHMNGKLEGLTIAIWGLSFKPGTDDLREASSLVAVNALLDAGANLRIFDPAAMPAAKKLFNSSSAISWCSSAEGVFDRAVDALVIATEWPQFKSCSLEALQKQLGKAPLIDGRNCFKLSDVMNANLAYYYSVGRPCIIKGIDK